MDSPVIPIALFAVLLTGLVAAIPLAAANHAALALVSLGVFTVAFGALAWWVINSDRWADPRWQMQRAAERFEARWDRFERDFWAHVDSAETESRL